MENKDYLQMRSFVEDYIKLCDYYKCEVVVNQFGVHCVQPDDGTLTPFAIVYPEWNQEV